MEGFLSLEQAAQQLQFSVSELSRQIEEGRVVAIVRDGNPWLSAGEVSRLKRQSERGPQPTLSGGEELRLLRLSTPEPARGEGLLSRDSEAQATAVPALQSRLERSRSMEIATPEPPAAERLDIDSSAPIAPQAPAGQAVDEKTAQQLRELNKRCAQLESRNQELESTLNRLRSGLQETEATLKRNRAARSNLENDVITLQDHLNKARARNEALEREVQHLGAELERAEDSHTSEMRRLRSNKADHRANVEEREQREQHGASGPPAELDGLRNQMLEKDRLLAQEYEQRAALRSQLEDKQQKYFELKARYDKEKGEWSELLAQALQNQGLLRQQIEELKMRANPKGWNPFRREK